MKKIKRKLPLVIVVVFVLAIFWARTQYYPPIIMYHSISNGEKGLLSVSETSFRRQMDFIKRHHYKVLSLTELCAYLKNGKMPRRSVVITSDDGYKDNVKMGRILSEYNFPATIFIITGKIGNDGFMNEKDLVFLDSNTPVDIGAHTENHAYLPECESPDYEIRQSKRMLESVLGHRISAFSYPEGRYTRDIQSLVKKAGFDVAVTTNRGYSKSVDCYALRRIKIKDSDKGIVLWAKLSGYYDLFRKLKDPG